MYQIQIKTDKSTKDFLKRFPTVFREALVDGMRKAILQAEANAKRSFGQPGKPNVISGRLRSSIVSSTEQRYNQIIGAISSNVIYAGIQEEGGIIRASNKKYLRFNAYNRWFMLKQVTIKPKHYLRDAVYNNLDVLTNIIVDTVTERMNNV